MSLRISLVTLGLLASVASSSFAGENLLMDAHGRRDPSNMNNQHATTGVAHSLTALQSNESVNSSGASPTATSGAGAADLTQAASSSRRVAPVKAQYDNYLGGGN
jgi:hypothetical protein